MNVPILLRHPKKWETDVYYQGYKRDGIIIGENISFVNLSEAIIAELDVDKRIRKLIIRYIVEANSSLITIRNDIGVKLYIEIKRREPGFGKHPLCVDTVDLDIADTEMIDGIYGSIIYVEVSQHDIGVIGMC